MKRALLALVAVSAAVLSLFGQNQSATPRPKGPPPLPPESAEFNFWVGDWEVFNAAGGKLGENRIEKIAANRGLLENWTGAGGGIGKSLNSYNPTKKAWQQFWVGTGGVLELSGGLRDGAMVMSGETIGANGARSLNRITWTPNADGTVRQHWEVSSDDGKTWTTSFDGIYRRKPQR